jgi:hypothetical protein
MAAVTKATTANVETTTAMKAPQISGLLAGEAIAACDFCYIKSDGLVWRSVGSSDAAAAETLGVSPIAAAVGEPVTILGVGTIVGQYATGLTPGANYYLGAAGALDTAATTGGVSPVAKAISATDIIVTSMATLHGA